MSATTAIFHDASARPAGSPRAAHLAWAEALRALAILIIVWSHAHHALPGFDRTAAAQIWLNFVSNGTVLFVFISGLLFHHIQRESFEYTRYLMKKLRMVIAPSLPWFALIALMNVAIQPEVVWRALRIDAPDGPVPQFLFGLLHATSFSPLWYIAFILLFFLAAPLLVRFWAFDRREVALALLASFVLAMLVNRPFYNIDKLHGAAHFLFAYLAGFAVSMYRAEFVALISRPRVIAACALFAVAAPFLQFGLGQQTHHMYPAFEWHGINLSLLGKFALGIAAMGFVARHPERVGKWTQLCAATSFGVFFCHWPIILAFQHTLPADWGSTAPLAEIVLAGAVVYGLSLALVMGIRRLLGKHAFRLVGA